MMRCTLPAFVCMLSVMGLALPASAQHFPPRGGDVYGVGCYWFRGHQYCNRYCYREIDGYRYCQPRLRDAGTQAPPPAGFDDHAGSPIYRQGRRY